MTNTSYRGGLPDKNSAFQAALDAMGKTPTREPVVLEIAKQTKVAGVAVTLESIERIISYTLSNADEGIVDVLIRMFAEDQREGDILVGLPITVRTDWLLENAYELDLYEALDEALQEITEEVDEDPSESDASPQATPDSLDRTADQALPNP